MRYFDWCYLFVQVCKMIRTHSMWCDVLGFWDTTIFCNKFTLPKRRIWKAEPTFPSAFSKHFLTFRSPNTVLKPLKSASKSTLKGRFGFPKSSFGEHKVCKLPTAVLNWLIKRMLKMSSKNKIKSQTSKNGENFEARNDYANEIAMWSTLRIGGHVANTNCAISRPPPYGVQVSMRE